MSPQFAAIADQLAVPFAMVAMATVSWAAVQAATWLRAKTHNEHIARIADAAGRVAGEVYDKLAALPAGTPVQAVRTALIADGVQAVKDRVGPTVTQLGANDAALAGMIAGELGKLNAGSPTKPAVPAPAGQPLTQ